jgi:hypothetical protein
MASSSKVRPMAALLLSVAVLSCSGESPTASGDTGDPRMRQIKQFPEFRADIIDLFERNSCTSDCHAVGQGGMTLSADDADATYGQLVNEPAHSEPFLRVKPYDADSSYVVIKVEGRNLVGSPMPPGDALDSIDLTNLRNWIDNGAPND